MKPQRHPKPRPSSAATPERRSSTQSEAPEANTPNSPVPERIPPQWSWHYRTLLHLRERLLRAPAGQATQAVAPADLPGGDVVDPAQEQTDRDLLWAQLGSEADRLFEVDCALQRIRDGLYGFCEETGHPIPAERLRAAPWTRYALAAAQPIEPQSAEPKK